MYYVLDGNKKYSKLLIKDIQFNLLLKYDCRTDEPITLLALLNNLTANAVEAIPTKGTITIEINQQADVIVFCVSDTGIGIAKENLSIIFEPGYTTKYDDEGVAATGIGLSHVAALVTKLNGTVSVDLAQGETKFIIKIPTQTIQTGET